MTREILLRQLNETISQLLDVYQNMANPEISVYEEWTAKDILGHIVFWHESFARNVRDIVNDIKPNPLKGNYSDLNQRCFDEMRTKTLDDLDKRLESAHKVIQENILNPKLVLIPYKKGSRSYTPEEHLDIVNEHIKEHLNSIRKADSEDLIIASISKMVDAGELAGVVTLVWQDGQVRQVGGAGWRDIERKLPMERDTVFRIASMTKPITSTAALMLMDEGRFALNDPITRWAPEFAQMRVLRSPSSTLDQTDPAERPITFEDLLTHRSGLTYADWHSGPIVQAYKEALGGDIDSEVSPDDWITRLSALPLIDQPGKAFHYGHSTDLLGLLIARMEDAPLGNVLKRRIFDPLGMNNTGFTVPLEKRQRQAEAFGFDDAGQLCKRLSGPGNSFLPERPEGMTYVSGGQGLWSTAEDYLTFARMFLNDGAVNDVQLLRPETLKRMVTNYLTKEQQASARYILNTGHGFGLGVTMVLDPLNAGPQPCGGGMGSVGWPGAFGGWWRADPSNNSVLIFLTHNMVELDQLLNGIGFGVYEAIMEFQAQASSLLRSNV